MQLRNPRLVVRQRGFTLIEILVSLAIVAIALLAGTQASTALSRGAERQTSILLGQLCADNELSKMRLAKQYPSVGDSKATCEQAGHTLSVHLEVRPTPNPSFRRVDARVTEDEKPVVNVSTIIGRN